MTAIRERASLLGLPFELRVTIYEHVIHARTDVANDKYGNGRLCCDFAARNESTTKYLTPWCSLMLACRQTASELRAHMAKLRLHKPLLSETWVVYLGMESLKPVQRTLPCSPTHLKTLRIHTTLRPPCCVTEIARSFVQTISLLTRIGPGLKVGRPPKTSKSYRSLCFGEVELSFSWICSDAIRRNTEARYGIEEKIVREFRELHHESRSDLQSAVDTIRLVSEDYEQAWAVNKS